MAEAAAARREARRRRILENSHNRLQQISGINSDESPRASPVKSSVFDTEPNIHVPEIATATESRCSAIPSLDNGPLMCEPETFGLLPTNCNIDETGDNEIANDLAAFTSNLTPQPIQNPTLWEKLITYRYDIVLLSITMQVLYFLFSISVDDVYILLPVAIYGFTKQMFAPKKPQSSIANALLLLNGLAPAKVQKLMFMTQLVAVFMQDVFVFIFTTICIQSLYVTLKEILFT